jgi:hypothetical protein
MDSVRIAIIMIDYTQKKPAPSRLLTGFGDVTFQQKPEDWHTVREDMEEAMAEEVSKEDEKK